MSTVYNFSNTSLQTTLVNPIGTSDTSVTLASMSGLPVSYPYSLIIDPDTSTVEVVTVTGPVGGALAVTRGEDGTAASSHNAGAKVWHGVVARDVRLPSVHINDTANIHGIGAPSSVVGTQTTQTLINKTIDGGSNTLTNIPASAVAQPFTRVRGVGADGTTTVLDIAGNEVGRTADIAVIGKTGAGLNVTKDGNIVANVGDVVIDATGTTPTGKLYVVCSSSKRGIVVRRESSGATADLQQWQDQTNAVIAAIDKSGNHGAGGAPSGARFHALLNGAASTKGLLVKEDASQTGNALETTTSGDVSIFSVDAKGAVATVLTDAASVGLKIKEAAAATGDGLQLQNSSGTNLFLVDKSGVGKFTNLQVGASPTWLDIPRGVVYSSSATPAVTGIAGTETDMWSITFTPPVAGDYWIDTYTPHDGTDNEQAKIRLYIGAVEARFVIVRQPGSSFVGTVNLSTGFHAPSTSNITIKVTGQRSVGTNTFNCRLAARDTDIFHVGGTTLF